MNSWATTACVTLKEIEKKEKRLIRESMPCTDLTNAATKIQASFRGHMARKQADKAKQDTDLKEEIDEKVNQQPSKVRTFITFALLFVLKQNVSPNRQSPTDQDDELLDIDLSDPSLNHAAIKIQAQFRGHMTRKTAPKE